MSAGDDECIDDLRDIKNMNAIVPLSLGLITCLPFVFELEHPVA